jgi:hypothetical protein
MLYGIISFCLMAVYATAFYMTNGQPQVADTIYLLSPLIALLSGVYALNYFSNGNYLAGGQRVTVSFWLALGILFYLLGEVFWFYLAYIQISPTSPSIADVFFLMAYPCLFAAAYLEYRLAKVKLTNKVFINPLFLLSLVGIILVAYFGIFQAYTMESSMLENIIAVSYGVGDLLLIMSILLVIFAYSDGKLRWPWIWIAISYIFMLAADLGYAFASDAYETSILVQLAINLFWMIGYYLIGKGFLSFVSVAKEVQVATEERLMAMKADQAAHR